MWDASLGCGVWNVRCWMRLSHFSLLICLLFLQPVQRDYVRSRLSTSEFEKTSIQVFNPSPKKPKCRNEQNFELDFENVPDFYYLIWALPLTHHSIYTEAPNLKFNTLFLIAWQFCRVARQRSIYNFSFWHVLYDINHKIQRKRVAQKTDEVQRGYYSPLPSIFPFTHSACLQNLASGETFQPA